MAQPTPYDRQYNFTDFQATAPTTPLPADQVDLEFNSVKVTIDEVLSNLELIQRDDGQLANNSVGNDQLKAEVVIGFNPPTTWATATNYAVRDYVFNASILYRALEAHTSGVFATDLAAGKWVEVAEFLGPNLLAIDALDMAADQSIYFTGATTAAAYALTAEGRAIAGLTSVGFPAITAAGAAASRTITGTANEISVANGTGAGGNPTISLPSAISLAGKTIDQGTFSDPILTGSPTAPTVANTITNTNIATTAFVKSVRLDQFATPNANVSFGSIRITNLADPSSAQDAATKNYVDGIAQGLVPKQSVACATTANITLSGEQTIDGVLTSASRVLVKNQSTASQNGIYVSAAGAWSRATDMDAWTEVPGAYTFVSGGTTQSTTGWICTSASGGTLGSTAINFTQFSGAGTYSAGTNLQLVGTVFSVISSPSFVTPNLNVATATSINKLTITTPASGSTLTIDDTKTFRVQNTITLAGTDARTYTFPSASGSVLTADSTNTLTNKTFDTAGTGNSFSINGVAATANTGTGAVARASSPTFVTPTLGAALATSINGLTITSSTGTLTITNAKTLSASNTLTLAGSDGTTITFQGTDTYVGRTTTDTLTNKTLTAPSIAGGTHTALTSLGIRSTGAAFDVTLAVTEVLTAGRTLTLKLNDAARTVDLGGNFALAGAFSTSGANSLVLTTTGTTNVTLPTTGTLATLAGTETLLNKTLTSPTMTTPTLGAALATSINGLTVTTTTGGVLTIANSKTLTVSNTLTLAGTDSTVMTFPSSTDTVAGLGAVQTFTGAKTFADAKLILAGLTSGNTTLKATAIAGTTTLTLPAATDTLVGKATTDTFTNKTFDTAGTGNVLQINGTGITAVTGTGAVVLAADPALTGNPTAPTQTAGNNSTRIATTAFVQAAVTAGVSGVASFGGQSGAITVPGGSFASTAVELVRYDAAQTLTSGNKTQAQSNIGAVGYHAAVSLTASEQAQARSNVSAALKGQIFGLTMSNNASDATNDIDVAVGEAASTDSNPQLMVLASALTKRLDANWAAGTNQGMRNSGAAITNTTYHLYLVSKANGADVDIYAHASATVATVLTALQAETGGSLYVHARRIGSIIRSGATILPFWQDGDKFELKTTVNNFTTSSLGTTAVLATVTVPGGIQVIADIYASLSVTSTEFCRTLISCPDSTDEAPTSNISNLSIIAPTGSNQETTLGLLIRTNTSSQVRYRNSHSSASIFLRIQSRGWLDRRGRDA